jgi:hypothetical protein
MAGKRKQSGANILFCAVRKQNSSMASALYAAFKAMATAVTLNDAAGVVLRISETGLELRHLDNLEGVYSCVKLSAAAFDASYELYNNEPLYVSVFPNTVCKALESSLDTETVTFEVTDTGRAPLMLRIACAAVTASVGVLLQGDALQTATTQLETMKNAAPPITQVGAHVTFPLLPFSAAMHSVAKLESSDNFTTLNCVAVSNAKSDNDNAASDYFIVDGETAHARCCVAWKAADWPKLAKDADANAAKATGKLTTRGLQVQFVQPPPTEATSSVRSARGMTIDGEYSRSVKIKKLGDAVCCLKGPAAKELGGTTRLTFPASAADPRIAVVHTLGKKVVQVRVLLTATAEDD